MEIYLVTAPVYFLHFRPAPFLFSILVKGPLNVASSELATPFTTWPPCRYFFSQHSCVVAGCVQFNPFRFQLLIIFVNIGADCESTVWDRHLCTKGTQHWIWEVIWCQMSHDCCQLLLPTSTSLLSQSTVLLMASRIITMCDWAW